MTDPSPDAVDTDALSRALRGAVRKALDNNPELEATIRTTVVEPVVDAAKRAIAESGSTGDVDAIAELKRAMPDSMNESIAEVVGLAFDRLAPGLPPKFLQALNSIHAATARNDEASDEPCA
ncbi:hypothetical protein ACTXG7_18705 [Mycolicibacterium sp. Dal123E01]|uniref:hypothetical protein n=1 Tax=Mycolicibacterium sp. Dal123E01 TaxID=3457578 RepID=UPI00403ECC35